MKLKAFYSYEVEDKKTVSHWLCFKPRG